MVLNWSIKTFFTKHIKIEEYIKNVPNISVMKIINYYSEKYNVPFYVLLGIFIIESTNRTLLFRFIEYIVATICGLLSLLLKKPIKNYTVGVCQVGIGNILYLNSNRDNRYDGSLSIKNYNEFKIVIMAFKKNNNIMIAAMLIKEFLNESKDLNSDRQIRYVGQKYNGKIEYGIFLSKLVQALEKDKIIERIL